MTVESRYDSPLPRQQRSERLLSTLAPFPRVALVSHVNPDPDALACMLGLKALIAAILGGIGSVPGAFVGGFAIGEFEALWSGFLPGDYRDIATYSLLAILLVLRPVEQAPLHPRAAGR